MNFDELETLPISRNEFSELELFKNVQFEKLAGFLLRCSVQNFEKGHKLIDPDKPNRSVGPSDVHSARMITRRRKTAPLV